MFGKKNKEFSSGLDVPPAPPPIKVDDEGFSEGAPEFPELPDLPPAPKKRLPSFEDELKKEVRLPPIKKQIEELEVPPPPEHLDEGMEIPPPPRAMPALQAGMDIPPPPGMRPRPQMASMGEVPPQMPSFDDVEEEISQEERSRMHVARPIFIRADNYKYVLDEVNVARNIANESSDIFASIESMNTSTEKEYENWRLSLEDVERKMLYVDKALFGR